MNVRQSTERVNTLAGTFIRIPLFCVTLDSATACLISILSLVRRSFLPVPRLGVPQVGIRLLECWDLRQSAASRRAATKRVCINHRFHEPWAHLQPAVCRLPVVRAQLDTRRHDLKTYQIQRSRGNVPSSGNFSGSEQHRHNGLMVGT